MSSFNLPQEEAFQYLQARRFCISPNLGFQHQLEAFQHIHEAKLAMERSGGTPHENRNRRKRGSDEEEEEVERFQRLVT